MRLSGLTTDVFVANGAQDWVFWERLLGRLPDLRPDDSTAEWQLNDRPEISLRVRVDTARAGCSRVGIGVDDLTTTLSELQRRLEVVPEPNEKPGIIRWVSFVDPSGNTVDVWQDLLAQDR